jgi:hypothetical protein
MFDSFAGFLRCIIVLAPSIGAISCSDPVGRVERVDRRAITEGLTDAMDFVDNTQAYKGKQVTVEAIMISLDDLRTGLKPGGKSVAFSIGGHSVNIYVPPELEVPNAKNSDRLIVTFICKEGKLSEYSGNHAVKIKRYPR